MSDAISSDIDAINGEVATSRRGRPVGAKNKPKPPRRNYAKEFADLQQRVWLAMSLLRRAGNAKPETAAELMGAAIDTLEDAVCGS